MRRYTKAKRKKSPKKWFPEIIEAIRELSPIEDVIGECVELRRSGFQLVAVCPFHAERTPSFYVHPVKEVFFCHGCGIGGDVFRFVQLLLNYTFRQSVEHLAARAGISLEGFEPSPELQARVAKRRPRREEKQQFERFCNESIDAINARHRSLGRAATNAESCLRSGVLRSDEEELAWAALQRYRAFEARVEREDLCDIGFLWREWLVQKGRADRHAAA
jgi:hypothetical protein